MRMEQCLKWTRLQIPSGALAQHLQSACAAGDLVLHTFWFLARHSAPQTQMPHTHTRTLAHTLAHAHTRFTRHAALWAWQNVCTHLLLKDRAQPRQYRYINTGASLIDSVTFLVNQFLQTFWKLPAQPFNLVVCVDVLGDAAKSGSKFLRRLLPRLAWLGHCLPPSDPCSQTNLIPYI